MAEPPTGTRRFAPRRSRSHADRPTVGAPQQVRRRLRVVAAAIVVGWTVVVAILGTASGLWQGRGPDGGRFVVGVITIGVAASTAVAYRRISGPVSDLVGAAEQVSSGNYRVGVEVRGFREVRLLTESFNEMADRLAANEQQRRRFLADITHELRNPLAVLQSEIEAQLDGVHPRDDAHLESLLDETRRLERLVDDLHTLALAETGRLVLRREVISLGALVDDVVARHEAHARQQQVNLRASIPRRPLDLCVDPARIQQVLDNLLTNALRHTPAGGEVLVAVTTSAGPDDRSVVRCEVTDTGPGFRQDELPHVFDRFERPGDSHGSGLGLSIARDLIRAHGGTIDAANDARTGGASVSFTFPSPDGGEPTAGHEPAFQCAIAPREERDRAPERFGG
jgi:two-component system OmpR family sensor kinase/two-component system sensor histidine kinase BaeS